MKKDIAGMIKRADRFKVILIGEGILVGLVAGAVVILYRVALEYAGIWNGKILEYASQGAVFMAAWMAVLAAMAVAVGKLTSWEPMISGSGIPQVEGEVVGKLSQNWIRVIATKFIGGFICMLAGLALGREGPVHTTGRHGRQSPFHGVWTEERRRNTFSLHAEPVPDWRPRSMRRWQV